MDISFSNGRSGSGPATWGQQAIWDVVNRLTPADRPRYNITTASPVDPGVPVQTTLDALRDLLHLHDSLHTRLHPDESGTGLRQTVDPDGLLTVHTRHCDDDPTELATAGSALHRRLAADPFDSATDWPLRVGLVIADGLVRHITLVLSHTAVDGSGMGRVIQDLTELALGATPESVRAERSPQQPLEEAEFQRSERGRRRDANARAHVLRKLRLGPPRLFPPTTAESAPFPNALLDSPALLRAVDLVATAHRASSSSVLLAAACTMTAELSGSPDVVIQVIVSNRFLPGLTDAVSVIASDGVFHLPNAAGDFGETVRRTQAAAIATYRHAYYERRLLDGEIDRLTAEGVPLADRSCIFNDTRDLLPATLATAPVPSSEPLDRARERTTLTWPTEFDPRPGLSYALDALQTGDALQLAMTADPAVLPRPAMARFLLGIENLVVGEAEALAGAAEAVAVPAG
ncbi:condensation domain-containing protein [Kitasatospora sp. NPDC058406]|uniref:condensation domain-containing protein n=1 Tax=Streptomycetaceae TaxID=2062 RepID=UPI002E78F9A9|nr:condensation domain-containing protein [Streptomyces sp. BE303]MED7954999.1 condensation domain-containing protein [Streptomyces sp. BE303]